MHYHPFLPQNALSTFLSAIPILLLGAPQGPDPLEGRLVFNSVSIASPHLLPALARCHCTAQLPLQSLTWHCFCWKKGDSLPRPFWAAPAHSSTDCLPFAPYTFSRLVGQYVCVHPLSSFSFTKPFFSIFEDFNYLCFLAAFRPAVQPQHWCLAMYVEISSTASRTLAVWKALFHMLCNDICDFILLNSSTKEEALLRLPYCR